jgi:hypothetical protein
LLVSFPWLTPKGLVSSGTSHICFQDDLIHCHYFDCHLLLIFSKSLSPT